MGCNLDVSVSDLDPSNLSLSTIEAIGPFIADGVTVATIRIRVIDNGKPVPGFSPIYKVTGSGNLLGQCSETDALGISTCSLRSTVAQIKIVSLTSPASKSSIEVTFISSITPKAGFTLSSGGGIQTGGGTMRARSSMGVINSHILLEGNTPGARAATLGFQGVLLED